MHMPFAHYKKEKVNLILLELSAKPAKPRTVGFLKQDGTQHKKI